MDGLILLDSFFNIISQNHSGFQILVGLKGLVLFVHSPKGLNQPKFTVFDQLGCTCYQGKCMYKDGGSIGNQESSND